MVRATSASIRRDFIEISKNLCRKSTTARRGSEGLSSPFRQPIRWHSGTRRGLTPRPKNLPNTIQNVKIRRKSRLLWTAGLRRVPSEKYNIWRGLRINHWFYCLTTAVGEGDLPLGLKLRQSFFDSRELVRRVVVGQREWLVFVSSSLVLRLVIAQLVPDRSGFGHSQFLEL